MLIVELVILYVLFWGICYLNTGSDDKNIKSYASYPDEVQEMVNKNPVLQSKIKTASSFEMCIRDSSDTAPRSQPLADVLGHNPRYGQAAPVSYLFFHGLS